MTIPFIVLSRMGMYGVIIYSLFIHTPRSIYLLVKKYGNNVYKWWIIFTIICYIFIKLMIYFEMKEINIFTYSLGIIFAHIICTFIWRNKLKY